MRDIIFAFIVIFLVGFTFLKEDYEWRAERKSLIDEAVQQEELINRQIREINELRETVSWWHNYTDYCAEVDERNDTYETRYQKRLENMLNACRESCKDCKYEKQIP